MGTVENKAVPRRFIEEAFNGGKLAVIDEVVSPNYVNHVAGTEIRGRDGMKQFIMTYRTAFPDCRYTIEDQVAEGDKVVTRWTARGTQEGELMGIPPTGKHVSLKGVVIDRLENGKLAETWNEADMLGMLQQLGVAPPPAAVGD